MSDATREAEIRAYRSPFADVHGEDDTKFLLRLLDEARADRDRWMADNQRLGEALINTNAGLAENARLRAAPDASDLEWARQIIARVEECAADSSLLAPSIANELASIRTTSYRDGYDAAKRDAIAQCNAAKRKPSEFDQYEQGWVTAIAVCQTAIGALNPDPPVSK